MTTVFLHGLGQTKESWEPVLVGLPEGDYRCLCLSGLLQGKEATFENLYSAIESYCGGIDGKFCLCGLSLGAELALQYAIDHSERLHSVVLIACQYKMPKLLLALQNVLFRFMPEENFQGLGFSKHDFSLLCRTTGRQNFSKGLEQISCPSLILCGGKDSSNRKASAQLSQKLSGSTLAILPGSGHEVNKDSPEQLSQLLRDFWRQLS